MTSFSLLTSGILGITLALGNPSSVPFTFSEVDISRSLPAFQLRTLQGTPVHSDELAGRVLILNFWAPWCGPCKEETPFLERLRQKFPTDQLAILAGTTAIFAHERSKYFGSNSGCISMSSWMNRKNPVERTCSEVFPQQ